MNMNAGGYKYKFADDLSTDEAIWEIFKGSFINNEAREESKARQRWSKDELNALVQQKNRREHEHAIFLQKPGKALPSGRSWSIRNAFVAIFLTCDKSDLY